MTAPTNADVLENLDRDARTIYDLACIREAKPGATREEVEAKAIALRLWQNLAAVAGIIEERDALRERLKSIADDCRRIYAITPMLPIEPETMEGATDALHEFCLMLGIQRIDISDDALARCKDGA